MPSELIGCHVYTKNDPNSKYVVRVEHYEQVKDMLDRGDRGWVELNHVMGGAKVLIRLEDIAELFLATESYCDERNEYDRRERMEVD